MVREDESVDCKIFLVGFGGCFMCVEERDFF